MAALLEPVASPSYPASPPGVDARRLEGALHRAVNRARRQRGQAPLRWRDSLALMARGHSRDMARRGYFSHFSPDSAGFSPDSAGPAYRAHRLGLPITRSLGDEWRVGVGENIFRTPRYDEYRDLYWQREDGPREHVRREYDWKSPETLVHQAVRGWLGSPPHRRTLLSTNYRRHGIGVVVTGKWVYVTQNLF
jgi:hypothetical protein